MTDKPISYERKYKRLMLRSSFQSLFWSILLDRKKKSNLNMSQLGERLGVNKSYLSRSFSSPPNWQIDKISDLADALGVEIHITARDHQTGEIFSPVGKTDYVDTSKDLRSSSDEMQRRNLIVTNHLNTLEFVA